MDTNKVDYNITNIILEYLKSNKKYILAYFLLSFASPLSEVVLPQYYGKIVNKFSTGESIVPEIKMVVILWIIYEMMYSTMSFIDSKFIPELQAYLRKEIVKILLHTFLYTNDDLEIGKIINKLTQLPMICSELVYQMRNYILPSIYVILFSIFYFFKVNMVLGVVALISIIVFFTIVVLLIKKFVSYTESFQYEQERTAEYISEILENIQNIYSNNTVDEELSNLVKKNINVIREYKKNLVLTAKLKLLFNIMYILVFIVINGYSYHLFSNKKIDIQQISSSFFIILYVINQLSNLSGEIPSFLYYLGVINDIQRFLDKLKLSTNEEIFNDYITTLEKSNLLGNIDFHNVTFKRENKTIFENLNLSIPKNSRVCIRGKIGSGKTTLINLIMGYCVPNEGYIEFDDQKIHPKTLRQYISYVRQNPKLFHKSIYENIVYGLNHIERKNVEDLMNKYNLSEVFRNHSIDDTVGKGGSHLSGGQKQIILLLHSILKNSPIVILDEPSASLDGKVKEKVIEILKDLFENRTVIVITHDDTLLNNIQLFNKVIDMNNISQV